MHHNSYVISSNFYYEYSALLKLRCCESLQFRWCGYILAFSKRFSIILDLASCIRRLLYVLSKIFFAINGPSDDRFVHQKVTS